VTGNLRIYFAGSIRGGREDHALYRELIDYLGRYGKVLTEHIGDAELSETGEKDVSDAAIFERDLAWLRSADAVVAEVSTPSLGVGYEIAVAEQLEKPILCLHHDVRGRRLSSMVAGHPGLMLRKYSDFSEVVEHIDRFFESTVRRM
jgi:nucleoside 2-deoxyribosyltransferase